MKKFLLPAIVLCALTAKAADPTTLKIHLKSGESTEYNLSDIDKLTFTGGEDTPTPSVTDYVFTVPTSFDKSYVQNVMVDGKKVGEVCLEYIKVIDKQVTVVYPCDADGKADLTKGMTTTGASVVWSTSNTATVGEEGETAAKTMYIVKGEVVLAYEGETADATVTPDILKDVRGGQTETYSIVKVATQYWMAENLRARNFADGTAIASIAADDDTGAWMKNTTGAYLQDNNADWVKVAGYFYNGYCVTAEAGIAPKGWAVPTVAELNKLKSAGNITAANFRSDANMAWQAGTDCNNKTGFSAIASGTYLPSTGITEEMTKTYFWSSTKYYDTWSKGDNLDVMYMTNNNKGNVTTTSSMLGGHGLEHGHCIRCIRK